MLTNFSICLMIVIIFQFNMIRTTYATSEHIKQLYQKRYSPALFGRYAIDPSYLLTNRPYYDDDIDKDLALYKKRQLKKKWAKIFERSHSPYTIAFPALIRTRR